mgnify:CR=1 FL=1|jgi:hypothetical protein
MGQAQTINIPDYQLERLAQPLIDAVAEYFKDPKVKERFEKWERERAERMVSNG